MQVEVADVGAHFGGAAEADLGVHVGAVHVDLAAVHVDDFADFDDGLLEDTVGAWVGDHERGEAVAVLIGLGAQVVEVDVAVFVAADDDDFHAGHDGAGGICTVGGGGDKADVAMVVVAAAVEARMTSKPAYSPCEPALG